MRDDLSHGYEAQVAALNGALAGTDKLRQLALKEFTEKGMPTTRSEEWRYSDLKKLRSQVFTAAQATVKSVPEKIGEPAARFVFINGRYHEELSDMGDIWQALSIRPLANHLMANPERANELVRGNDGICLLNTALMRDGLVFSVPAGIEIDEPIEILNIMTDADTAAVHIRHVVELGEGAKITLLERFVGDDSNYWVNSVVQARVTENASLHHIRLQEEGSIATHTAKAFVNVDAGGNYTACNIALGAGLDRFETHVRLLVDDATAYIDGVALAATEQSHDMYVHVDHRMPETTSDQIFRTVAAARGKTSFQGKVTVAQDAQKTIADQSFKALLLDRTAEANAKPELEIFADDVKCSHGATIGELDQKALFYLISRGIDPVKARQMLIDAFMDDALLRITDDAIGDYIREKIAGWMNNRTSDA
jgi:Fe-S cluster assembly protein SufD